MPALETPNPKHQTPNKFQPPISKPHFPTKPGSSSRAITSDRRPSLAKRVMFRNFARPRGTVSFEFEI
jgi:hypothetical protein